MRNFPLFGVKVSLNVWESIKLGLIKKSVIGLMEEFVQLNVKKADQSKVEKLKASVKV